MVKRNLRNLFTLVTTLSLITFIWISGGTGCSQNQTIPTQVIENITPQETFSLIQDNEQTPEFVILDIRTADEFAEGHLENAINLD